MPEPLDLAALALEVLEQMDLAPGRGRERGENWIKILVAHFERVQAETREADAQIAEIYTQLSQDPDSMPEAERTESLMLRTQRVVAEMIVAALRARREGR